MPRYIALLRGINTGGHRIKMDRLRVLFEKMGFADVATFIASGNVVFSTSDEDASALERRIERHLEESLGYEVATFLRTPAELADIASFGEPAVSVYVVFLASPAGSKVRRALRALESDMDRFHFAGREIYWLIDGKLSESPLFGPGLTKALGKAPHTARVLTTIRRLVARHGPEG